MAKTKRIILTRTFWKPFHCISGDFVIILSTKNMKIGWKMTKFGMLAIFPEWIIPVIWEKKDTLDNR